MRSVVWVCLLAASACAVGQTSRWALGGPSLSVDLPSPPSARAVAWDEPGMYAFTVSNWGSESDGSRIGIALRYESLDQSKSWIARRLGATWANERTGKVSGYFAVSGSLGSRRAMLVQQGARTWVLVGEVKSAGGEAEVARAFDSVTVEKIGAMKWTRRAIAGRLSAQLPYELSPEREGGLGSSNARNANFSGFQVNVDTQAPDPGKRIDIAASINGMIAERRGMPNVTDFKSTRKRVKVGKAEGDLVQMTFKQGAREGKLSYVLVMEGTVVHRVEIGGLGSSPQHDAWHDQVLGSLELREVSYVGFEARDVATEGILLDLPGPLRSKSGVGREYELFNGVLSVNLRVTDLDSASIVPAQVAAILDSRTKATSGVSDYRSDSIAHRVDHLDAQTLKATYKIRAGEMVHHSIVIAAPDRAYTLEVIAPKAQAELVERVIQSVEVNPTVPNWRILPIGQTGLRAVVPAPVQFQPFSGIDPWMSSANISTSEWSGAILLCLEAVARPGATIPQPATAVKPLFEGFVEGMEGKGRVLEQSPAPYDLSGVHQRVEVSLGGTTRPGDVLGLKVGNRIVVFVLLYDPASKPGRQARHAFLSTLRAL